MSLRKNVAVGKSRFDAMVSYRLKRKSPYPLDAKFSPTLFVWIPLVSEEDVSSFPGGDKCLTYRSAIRVAYRAATSSRFL